MNASIRAALYARVSTSNKGQDVGLQLDELRQVAAQRGWTIVEEFSDNGISGTRDRRPELDRLVADARAGRFDVVAVFKLDRLARSLRHLLALSEDFSAWGVGLVSLHDAGIDTTSASGRLLFQVLGAFGEFEAAIIRERVIAGVRRAQAKGTHCGRPRKDLDLRAARLLLAQGQSLRQVADMLKLSRTTLKRRLREDGGAEGIAEA
ncbi:MAG: recombinase family protein [Pseudomonadota bacterium]